MKRTTRREQVEVEVELEILELTEDQRYELINAAQRIFRICNLVEQEFDRKAIAQIAQSILVTLDHE